MSIALRALALTLLFGALLATGGGAQEAPAPRVIAPELFAPSPRAAPPSAPTHTLATAPTLEKPEGACERRAREWISCLDATARHSHGLVDEAEARVIALIEIHPRLNTYVKAALAKKMKGLGDDWRSLRDRECDELGLLERGVEGPLFEARLICRIRRDLERVKALRDHYGDGS